MYPSIYPAVGRRAKFAAACPRHRIDITSESIPSLCLEKLWKWGVTSAVPRAEGWVEGEPRPCSPRPGPIGGGGRPPWGNGTAAEVVERRPLNAICESSRVGWVSGRRCPIPKYVAFCYPPCLRLYGGPLELADSGIIQTVKRVLTERGIDKSITSGGSVSRCLGCDHQWP